MLVAGTAEAGGLSVSMADGDPHDRIRLRNTGDCAVVAGALQLDFRGSKGAIVLDTAYGGIGTKDPMPVDVEVGNITVPPVADGDREMTILIGSIAPGAKAVVTLDFDNDASGWFARRVSILGNDVVGTVARYAVPGGEVSGVFEGAALELALPEGACGAEEDAPVVMPVS